MKYFIISRIIHRLLVLVLMFMTLLMSTTGMFMKYPAVAKIFPFVDSGMMRFVHNNLSPFFGVLLFLMMITGIIMYIFPHLKRQA